MYLKHLKEENSLVDMHRHSNEVYWQYKFHGLSQSGPVTIIVKGVNEENYVDMPRGLDYCHCYLWHCTLKIIRAIKGSPKRPIIRTLK